MNEAEITVEEAFANGTLYVEVDAPIAYAAIARGANFVGLSSYKPSADARVRFVHVMSRAAGGEIRGYVLTDDGMLRTRLPCYSGDWPDMDQAVLARVVGATVVLGFIVR